MEWINSSDKLPNTVRDVLMFANFENGWYIIGFYEEGKWYLQDGTENSGRTKITHWAELPEKPIK